ncbi:MAG: hypothetical protein IJO43_04470 [Bacilli bacterium]|nr:hypothetical protein [Bacilli bacterium]
MSLEIQIQSLIVSFIFGMFFSVLFNLFYKFLFIRKKIIKITVNFLFITITTLLYFSVLCIINSGIIHSYFIIMLILGFWIGNKKSRRIRKDKLEI